MAGPFDIIKGATSGVHGADKALTYADAGSKFVDALGTNTKEGRQRVGQAVALAATDKYHGLDERDAVQGYVSLVGLTIAHAADPDEKQGKYVFGVLDSDEPTACSGPGGYVMITRGALAMMSDESELAGVLAHEIGHVAKNHGIQALQTSKMASAASEAGGAANSQYAAFNSASDNLTTTILENGYSQGQETEADKLAVQYLGKAGYDQTGFLRFLKKLQAAKASGGMLFSTHPATADRVKTVSKIAKPGGVTNAERFQKYMKSN
jgi:predicted Zn-dependent protease